MKVEDIPDHTNKPRPKSRDMFEPPPAEIGEIVSGDSTLRTGDRGYPLWVLVVVSVGIFGFAGLIAHEVPRAVHVALVVIGAAGVTAGMWYAMRFKHVVTYVGRDGLARITVTGSRRGPRRTEILRFASADELRVEDSTIIITPVAQQQTFGYRWFDRSGRRLFLIEGPYVATVVPHDPLNFAHAAEAAWCTHRLARYEEDLARDGFLVFSILGGKSVRVGRGFLELRGFAAQPVRLTREELDGVTLREGAFRVNHVDATWYGKGKFTIKYGNLGNAQLFVAALKQFLPRPAA